MPKLKTPWVNLKGESTIAVKAQCVKCTTAKGPEQLHLLVLKAPKNVHRSRQAGRIRIYDSNCINGMDVNNVIFDKILPDLTSDDVLWMITDAGINYTMFDQDLLIDFSIIIHHYRDDVRFQNF